MWQGVKMRQVWIGAVVLSAALAGLVLSCEVPVQQVPANTEASVPCPHLDAPSSANFSLLRDGVKVASGSTEQNTGLEPTSLWQPGVTFQVLALNTSHFSLSPEMVNRTGLYTCQLDNQSPSPNASGPEKETHTIIVADPCSSDCISDNKLPFFWAWAAGCGLLTIYSLVVILLTIRIWHKLKKCDSDENDYINMKPRGFQGHTGAQQPTKVKATK